MVGADATGSVEQACLDAVDLIVTVALRRDLKRFDLFELCTRCVCIRLLDFMVFVA